MTPVSLKDAVRQAQRIDKYMRDVANAIQEGRTSGEKLDWSIPRCEVLPFAALLKEVGASPSCAFRPKVTYRQVSQVALG